MEISCEFHEISIKFDKNSMELQGMTWKFRGVFHMESHDCPWKISHVKYSMKFHEV